jgi:hypothetical protein
MDANNQSAIHMAAQELYSIAKNAIELSKMLKFLDNIEGWCASDITSAADKIANVREHLEYTMVSSAITETEVTKPKTTLAVQLGAIAAKVPPSSDENIAFGNVLAGISEKLVNRDALTEDETRVLAWIRALPRPIKVEEMISAGVKKFGEKLVSSRKHSIRDLPKVDENIMGRVLGAGKQVGKKIGAEFDKFTAPSEEMLKREKVEQRGRELYRDWNNYLVSTGMNKQDAWEMANKMADSGIMLDRNKLVRR